VYSLIKVALLESLGILGGVISNVMGSFSCKYKEIPFCDFKHFGVVKVAWIGLVKPEVFEKKFV